MEHLLPCHHLGRVYALQEPLLVICRWPFVLVLNLCALKVVGRAVFDAANRALSLACDDEKSRQQRRFYDMICQLTTRMDPTSTMYEKSGFSSDDSGAVGG